MSTSGLYSFALNRDQMLSRAMQMVNIININQTAKGADYLYAIDIFNAMIKMWQADGVQLWNRKQAVVFTQYNVNQYLISATSSTATNSYVSTTTTAAAAQSATILYLTSTAGMSINDKVGIEMDDNTRQWTTISNVNSSTEITIAVGLETTAASGNTVVSYTNQINDRPLRILDARTIDLENNNTSIPMEQISYDQYFSIPVKTSLGRPINQYYDKLLGAGNLYVYPTPNDVAQLIQITYHEELQDVDNSTDSLDFPVEWTLPIIYGLAVHFCIAYGKFDELKIIKPLADEYYQIVRDFDNDEAPLFILPDMVPYNAPYNGSQEGF
jgi:hypothetical protein